MDPEDSIFFIKHTSDQKVSPETNKTKTIIIKICKKYHSVPNVKVALNGFGYTISEKSIYNIAAAEGFTCLSKRSKLVKQQLDKIPV